MRLVRLRKEMDLFDAIGALKEARIAAEARAAKLERSSPEAGRAPSPPPAHVDRILLASLQAGLIRRWVTQRKHIFQAGHDQTHAEKGYALPL